MLNSSPRSAAYMRQWNGFAAPSHYLEQCSQVYIPQNGPENVFCEMVVMLSRGRWVQETNYEIAP